MAEPVAETRQPPSTPARTSYYSRLLAKEAAERPARLAYVRQQWDEDAKDLIEDLSPQERAIVDDLMLRFNLSQVFERFDLPRAWKAYAADSEVFLLESAEKGQRAVRRRRNDPQADRWLSAVRQLLLHQFLRPKTARPADELESEEAPASAPAKRSDESGGQVEGDCLDDLLALAQRLASEASALAKEYPVEPGAVAPPIELRAVAEYLRQETVSGRADGWLSSVWRYVRTGTWASPPTSPAPNLRVRLQLVNDSNEPVDELIGLDAAAEYLGLTKGRISQLVLDGTLTKYPLGERFYLVAKGDLDRYADSTRRAWTKPADGKNSA